MEDIHIRVLDKAITALTKHLDPDTVVGFLISKEVLDTNDHEKIQAKDTRAEKVFCLISILKTRGKNAYKIFIQSLEQDDFNNHLAETLRHLETTTGIEETLYDSEISQKKKCIFRLPADTESDEEDVSGEEQAGLTFENFLELLGLRGKFPAQLTLSEYVSVKDPEMLDTNGDLVELFWHKLSSLDYRARSKFFIKQHYNFSSEHINIKDFVFAILHCSDMFLRQDILEKMSACQLAVPLILQGVGGNKPEMLSWSLRRIVKKWKDQSSNIHERHIVTESLFTVSFLRIGELKNISKSTIINHFLGPHQGNRSHSYFVTRDDDVGCAKFSVGSIECVWYLPVKSNESEQLHSVMSVLNLRGDSSMFPNQTDFLCKASNLTIALIAKRNKDATEYEDIIDKVKSTSKRCLFVIIDDNCDMTVSSKRRKSMRWVENCLFVRFYEIGSLCDSICSKVKECNINCLPEQMLSIEQLEVMCEPHIKIEVNQKIYQEVRTFISKIFPPGGTLDVSKFKDQSFPLLKVWREWDDIDREPVKPDSEKEISVEFARDEIEGRKEQKRKLQLECGLSKTVATFQSAIDEGKQNLLFLRYFMSYLQEELFHFTYENTKTHLGKIEELEKSIENIEEITRQRATENYDNTNNGESHGENLAFKNKVEECKLLCKTESEACRKNTLGWEHFLRELGQHHEAHVALKVDKATPVASLPNLAVMLLLNEYSLEIMDGDTGSVPLTWVTSVLRSLAIELKNPPVFVLSILGVQSSGKSTLLNTLFGVRFPVRAGRCTRGLFLRMLPIDDQYAEKLRAKYMLIIDSEGIRSLERTEKYDNELATLALGISDITIFNIEGEVLSPDMAGVLEIAAHALIRMKQVDLHTQCRIIQQKVSDLTASERNKVNMDHLIDTLDDATVEAAKIEGFSDRYHKFSDVFSLRRDKDLQFIPCLWTKPMSPPNELYSQIVMGIKKDILRDIELGKITPQFTVLTFTQRVRDMWAAVKDEKFLFNFQDSIKAVDFHNLCMEFNKWITEMRLKLIQKQVKWQRRLLEETNENLDDAFELITKECGEELDALMAGIRSKFDSFVTNYGRRNNLEKHVDWFKQNLEQTASDIKHKTLSVLYSEKIKMKLNNDISNSAADLRSKVKEDIKLLAEEYHKATESGSIGQTQDPDLLFSSKWKEWISKAQHNVLLPAMSEKAMEAACEELLMSVTKDMAIKTDIHILSNKEGGVKKHCTLKMPWKTYYPHEKGSKYVEDWFNSNQDKIDRVVQSSVQEIQEKGSQKSFDANLFQYILQSALQQLSPPYLTSEAPCRLKAKILLHICGKLFKNALRNQRAFESKVSVQNLMEKERESLQTYFMALIKRGNQVDHAVKCLTRHLSQSGKDVTLRCISFEVIRIFMVEKEWAIKPNINVTILQELCKKENFEEFSRYISNHTQYIQEWSHLKTLEICCNNINNQSQLNVISHKAIDGLSSDLVSIIEKSHEKVKQKCQSDRDDNSLYTEWVECFLGELARREIVTGRDELTVELRSFRISNLENFLQELKTKLKSSWKDIVYKELQIPVDPNPELIKNFLESMLPLNMGHYGLLLTCLAQCPFCKAACDNPLPRGSLHKHTSSTHLPRGMIGAKNPVSLELIIDDCTACVSSLTASYIVPGTSTKRLFKDYEQDFPEWSIPPQGNVRNYSKYWKWVMTRFNRSLAAKYKCEPAQIPPRWRNISKQDALNSLSPEGSDSLQIDHIVDLMMQLMPNL